MVTRRDLLQAGAAISVLPWAAHAATDPEVSAPTFHTVLFDAPFREAREFGAEGARLQMNVRGFHGDITNVWFRELAPVWRSLANRDMAVATADMAIAGLTQYGALFCLERLAWDAGMRVVYRAEHPIGSTAPRMASLGRAQGSTVASGATVAPLGPHSPPDMLLSWIIAPKDWRTSRQS